jgi:hypothetical protein
MIFYQFYKNTFGIGDRFKNAHSYLKNNPPLKGRLKRYSSSKSISSKSNDKKRNNSFFDNINSKRTIDTSLSVNLNDISNKRRIKRNTLSIFNNKSSSCITPGAFNPLINYQESENNYRKKRKKIFYSNRDHFKNMTPTQISKYRPLVKRPMYNHYLESQIDFLPGRRPPHKPNIYIKKTGKKMIKTNIYEESKDIFGNKWSDFLYNKKNKNNNTTNINNNKNKFSPIYEFGDPVISSRDIGKKDKTSKIILC